MDSQLTVYITLVTISGVLNLLLTLYVYMNRSLYGNIATMFILGTLAKMIYCFAYAFSLTSSALEQLRFWSVMQYVGMPYAPPLGLLFILSYLGYRLTKWRIAALLVIPTFSLLSNATNGWHHLYYKTYTINEALGPPYNYIEVGPLYIVHGAFTFVCFISSLFLLALRMKDTDSSNHPQLIALILAHLIPMGTSFSYLIGITPPGIDPVPMVLGFSSLFIWWAIVSSRLLTIVPIAKETIFNSIKDGVIVFDIRNRMVEYNHGCQSMFNKLDRSLLGQPLDKVWPDLFGGSAPVPDLSVESQELEVVSNEPNERIYQVRISPLKRSANSPRDGSVMIITDITELKRMQLRLEHHAYYDELTDVFNRRAFFDRCEDTFASAVQQNIPFTVILFDIDEFKKVNDTHGHAAGDRVLIHVSQLCKANLADNMLFARYGGEEFVLALFGKTAEEGETFAEHLRQQIEAQPVMVDGQWINVTSSFGIAELTDNPEESLMQLLHSADEALYAAKRGGRNRVCIYGKC